MHHASITIACHKGISLIIFGATVFLSAIGVHTYFSQPMQRWEKQIEYVINTPKTYDVLFVGSSRFFNGVDPLVFDEVMKEHGIETTSFNTSAQGATMHFRDYILRRLLKGGAEPKFLVIEANDFSRKSGGNNTMGFRTARYIEWHDWNQTRSVLNTVVQSKEPLFRLPTSEKSDSKASLIYDHLTFFGARALPIGQMYAANVHGGEWELNIPNPFLPDLYVEDIESFERVRGYDQLESRHFTFGARWEQFRPYLEDPVKWNDRNDKMMVKKEMRRTRRPSNLEAFLAQISLARAAGVQLLYVQAPSAHDASPPFDWMVDRGIIVNSKVDSGEKTPVYRDFNVKGKTYLDNVENRFDITHIGAMQVPEFTRDVAHWVIEDFYPENALICSDMGHNHSGGY